MKKRNEEGYVLVYVMVVVFVLCAIALALMSGTLRTLQAQEAMVQRMKDKYEAMGEIEKIAAELEQLVPLGDGDTLSGKIEIDGPEADVFNEGVSDLATYFRSDDSPFDFESIEYCDDSLTKDHKNLILTVTTHHNSVSITAKILIIPSVETIFSDPGPYKDETTGNIIDPPGFWTYEVLGIDSLSFESYKLTSTGGDTQ